MLLRDFLGHNSFELTISCHTASALAGQYTAKLEPYADIIEGFTRRGVLGYGRTPRAAIEDYIRGIQGCGLDVNKVFIEVPEDLALGKSVSCTLEWD